MKNTTIMSHFDNYSLVIMTDNEVSPIELFSHFLHKRDTASTTIEYEKDDDNSLTFKSVTVKGDNGYYFEIDFDKFSKLNISHFLNISW